MDIKRHWLQDWLGVDTAEEALKIIENKYLDKQKVFRDMMKKENKEEE